MEKNWPKKGDKSGAAQKKGRNWTKLRKYSNKDAIAKNLNA